MTKKIIIKEGTAQEIEDYANDIFISYRMKNFEPTRDMKIEREPVKKYLQLYVAVFEIK